MGFGDLFNATAKGLSSDIDQRQQTAMQYKMHSALIQQQLLGQQQVEQEKFNRENYVQPGVAESALASLAQDRKFGPYTIKGMDVSKANPNHMTYNDLNEMVKAHQQNSSNTLMGHMMSGGMPTTVPDPISGIPMRTDFINPITQMAVRSTPNQQYDAAQQRWIGAQAGKDALHSISTAYSKIDPKLIGPLSQYGADVVGRIGGLMPGADDSWVKEQQQAILNLNSVLNEQGPALGIALSRISPGRFMHNMAQQIQEGNINLANVVKNFQNIRDNAQFRLYSDQKITGGHVDPNDEAKFGNMPKGTGGAPLPVAFYNGKAYDEKYMDKQAEAMSGTTGVNGNTQLEQFGGPSGNQSSNSGLKTHEILQILANRVAERQKAAKKAP
jgi:hypothetical protein